MSDSTSHASRGKAAQGPSTLGSTPAKKPRPDFPLSIHKGTGYWCKKIKGRVCYFGKVANDPKGEAAEAEYLRDRADLEAGREPRDEQSSPDGLRLRDLCNEFLTTKKQFRDSGELSPRTYQTYYATCETVVKHFGKDRAVTDLTANDFLGLRAVLSKRRGAVALRNEMQRVRSLFKFAFDNSLILAPIRFGQGFAKPKKEVVRGEREDHRMEHGDRMFESEDIRAMLEGKTIEEDEETKAVPGASLPLRAMILLAANCGFGQSDLSSLPTRAVNLDTGWVDFARVKTRVPRRIPLWPETVQAIREWLDERPKAKDSADGKLLFLTCRGQRWVKLSESGAPSDAIGQEFGKLLKALKLKRPRVSFYALRHTFETIGGESLDQVAVNAIMGHVDSSMAGAYRERISDERLRAVTDHVRAWLWPDAPKPKRRKGGDNYSNYGNPPAEERERKPRVKKAKSSEQAISGRSPAVVVEYDGPNGGRIQERFEDAFTARRAFTRLDKQGKRPRVLGDKPALRIVG